MNLMATIILGMQTFDMGLISDNCGDVEVCVPFVKPIALAGWVLVAGSLAFVRNRLSLKEAVVLTFSFLLDNH
jgi:hypothetical protein